MNFFSNVKWSIKLDLEMMFLVNGISFIQKILFIAKKYWLFLEYFLSKNKYLNEKNVNIFGRPYFINTPFALASLQRVYCSSSFLKEFISPETVIVDVGANVGQFNFFCRHYLKAKKIISIEPVIESYELLLKNAGNQDCYNYIISDREGGISFHVNSKFTQLSTYVGKDAAVSAVVIQSLRLDTLLDKLCVDRVDLLKVDTEGSEYEVIKSAGRSLEIVGAALIEVSIFRENVGSLFRVGSYMENSGFRLDEFVLQAGHHPTDADAFFIKP